MSLANLPLIFSKNDHKFYFVYKGTKSYLSKDHDYTEFNHDYIIWDMSLKCVPKNVVEKKCKIWFLESPPKMLRFP